MKPIRAKYRRPGGAGWEVTATVDGKKVALRARTLERARFALAEHAGTALTSSAAAVPIDDDIELPPAVGDALMAARAARNLALRTAAESQLAMAAAVRLLVDDGVSLRDTAYLLGLSHSRIQQLLERGTT
jgi:hypothetical protein